MEYLLDNEKVCETVFAFACAYSIGSANVECALDVYTGSVHLLRNVVMAPFSVNLCNHVFIANGRFTGLKLPGGKKPPRVCCPCAVWVGGQCRLSELMSEKDTVLALEIATEAAEGLRRGTYCPG